MRLRLDSHVRGCQQCIVRGWGHGLVNKERSKEDQRQIWTSLGYTVYLYITVHVYVLMFLQEFTLPTITKIGGEETKLTFREIINRLQQTYCQNIGIDYMFINDRQRCESVDHLMSWSIISWVGQSSHVSRSMFSWVSWSIISWVGRSSHVSRSIISCESVDHLMWVGRSSHVSRSIVSCESVDHLMWVGRSSHVSRSVACCSVVRVVQIEYKYESFSVGVKTGWSHSFPREMKYGHATVLCLENALRNQLLSYIVH